MADWESSPSAYTLSGSVTGICIGSYFLPEFAVEEGGRGRHMLARRGGGAFVLHTVSLPTASLTREDACRPL